MGDYQRLLTDADADVQHNTLDNSRQNVYYVKPLYNCHKITFASSILFFILVFLFIWVVPCNVYPCVKKDTDITWDKTLNGLELKGRMHLVGGNLIAILRGAKWGKTQGNRFPPPQGGGVIALLGKTGEELYWLPLTALPRYIDCSVLDLVVNGVKACLVVGEGGYIAALNPITGLVEWKVVANKKDHLPQPHDVDVPLLIPDIDGDGLRDLVTLSRYTSGHHRLIFISAKTGNVIKHPSLKPECSLVSDLTYDFRSSTLFYTCSNKITSKIESYKLSDIKSTYLNSLGQVLIPDEERKRFEERNNFAGEHKVIVSNNGTCPHDCYVSVNVTDSNNKTIWYYHSDRTYIMYPVPLHFKHSITGFLLKLWKWNTPSEKQHSSYDGVTVELIKERIVLITFNKSGIMHVVNASQIDIIQLCYDNECQPHLSFQTQSALIADLSGDGTQDLVSYFVTYKPSTEDPLSAVNEDSIKDWVLESRVKVVRLEAELPKLYEAVSTY
ncbi:uncharacterized protein LOC106672829 [Cimex lectularius]|uniref:FAM234A/B beta-propeller domain-containing protein n=1 Tax=Cimex lectularius TaxID=79782 RepID=A0A8I6S9R4_CIMLE|nr:uncharacterized protein LOC106672829 [Cimex lectularius]